MAYSFTRHQNGPSEIIMAEHVNELQVAIEEMSQLTELNAHIEDQSNPHNVTKTQVGLGNVDNTSDLNKPISTATQLALDDKADANHDHDADYAAITHGHVIGDVTGLSTALAGKSDTGHTHDERYYTETEIDSALAGKADTGHTHTIADVAELQDALDDKAASNHTHIIADVTGLQTALDGKAASNHNHDTVYAPLAHASATNNPHSVTKSQVGLGNVPNVDATNRANHTGTQLSSTISDFNTAVDARITAKRGANNGIASLDATGRIPSSQIPPIAMTDVSVVNSQAAQLGLSGQQEGDVVIRTDISKTFIHNGGTSGTMSDWTEMVTPVDGVTSVNGKAGPAVTLTTTDISEGSNLYYTEARVNANANVSANTAARHSHSNKATLDATTAAFTTTLKDKLDGIEAGADKTNTAKVDAAGAVMNTDTSTASMQFVVDEDNMASNSATKVPTQQSVKAYVDTGLAGKAASSHTHPISQITDLQTTLDNKAAANHTHPVSDVNNFAEAVRDTIGGALVAGDNVTIDVDDAEDTITIHADGGPHTHPSSDITDFASAVSSNTAVAANTAARHTHSNKSVLDNTSASFTTTLKNKLDGIEAGADVTDATNVDAAGAVMNSDTSTAAMGFVVDEDNFASDSATKVPTQQSVKAYVDAGLATKAAANHNHDTAYAAKSHGHAIGDVSNLQSVLDGKAAAAHGHAASDITSGTLNIARIPTGTTGSTVALGNHNHSGVYAPASHTHDDRYYTETEIDSMLADLPVSGHTHDIEDVNGLEDALDDKADVGHSHVISDVTGLQTALDGKAASGHTHTIGNITGLQTALDGKAAVNHDHDEDYAAIDHDHSGVYAPVGHTHTIANVTGLQTALDGKAASSHTHSIGNVTGLQTALDGKAAAQHTHDVDDIDATGTASSSTFLRGDGTWATPTNTTYSLISQVEAENSASTTARLVSGQRLYQAVQEHAPVKAADLAGKADVAHSHAVSDITNLQSALDGKAAASHEHAAGDITSGTLNIARIPTGTTGSTVALGNHTHTGMYAPVSHNHDERYYTETEIDAMLSGLSVGGHTHDIEDVTGLQTALDGKAASSHTHGINDINATGTKSSSTYLRGDGTWATPPNTTYSLISQAEAENSGSTTSRLVSGQRLYQAVQAHAPVKVADLDGKANVSHTHTIANVTGLQTALDGKAATSHDHDDDYAAIDHNHSGVYAPVSHNHDDRYYTESETNSLLSGKAASSHNHDIDDINATGTKSSSTYLRGDGTWTTPPNTTYSVMSQAEAEAGTATTSRVISAARLKETVQYHAPVKPADLTTKADVSHTHDDRYYTETEVDAALSGKANTSHTHDVDDISASGTPSTSTYLRGDGQWATPPNTTYTLISQAEAENSASTNSRLVSGQRLYQAVLKHAPVQPADLATKADADHGHVIGDITGLQAALDGKAASSHNHSASNITSGTLDIARIPTGTTGSTVALGNHTHTQYASTSHTHEVSDIDATGSPSSSTYLRGDGQWASPPNTTYSLISQAEAENSASTTARLVSGQRLYQAVQEHAPVKAADLANKADVGHTHTKSEVGLGNVDNTADMDKPVSTAMLAALDTKASAIHSHSASDITAGTINIARIPTGTTSDTVALGNHTHAQYASTSHTHDDRYYTETEVNNLLSGKADSAHSHDIDDINATGTKSSSTYLRGDGTWATPSSSSYSLISQAEAENSASTTARLVSGQRLYQAVQEHAPVKPSDLDGKADVNHEHGTSYIWGGSWLTGTDTRIPIPIVLTGGKAYNNLAAAGSGGNYGTATSVARSDHGHAITSSVSIVIDGGGAEIETGVWGDIEIPYDCTITGWTLLADQVGSITIDVWRDNYAAFPPTSVDAITGSEKPTLSSAVRNQDLNLTTWSASLTAGQILRINVDSASNVERVTLSLRLTRNIS